MATSSTTRKGNGAGYGGPAKGASKSRLVPAGDAISGHIRALAHDPKHHAAKAPLRELAMQTWANVMQNGESEGARVMAAEKLLDRIDGKATQRSELSGPDGAALPTGIQVTFVEAQK